MKNKLQIFENELGKIRITEIDGEPWFVANDVADALGYALARKAVLDHTDEEDRKTLNFRDCSKTELSELWGENDFRPKTLINEAGVYSLVFSSNLETAKGFKRWVTGTVLPSIRRNGGYIVGQEDLASEDQEKVLNAIKAQYEAVQQKLEQRTEKWHAAAQARDAFRSQVRAYKRAARGMAILAELDRKTADLCRKEAEACRKETKACRKDSDESFSLYEKMVNEVIDLEKELSAVKKELSLYKPTTRKTTVKVNEYGFVVS